MLDLGFASDLPQPEGQPKARSETVVHLAFAPLGAGPAAPRLLRSHARTSATSEGLSPSANDGINDVARRRTPVTSLRSNTCSTPFGDIKVRLVAPSSFKMPVTAVPSVICTSVVS